MMSRHDKLGRLKAMRKRIKRAINDQGVPFNRIFEMRFEHERELEKTYASFGYDAYNVFLEKYVIQERNRRPIFNGYIV